ncbi:HpcH/HpaI aldolase family protein [Microbacterium marinilacus]|uniref:Aldolase/citrate lyase family protein n=1 Tax=Microbacterium marinilacus TaxID=415209 RepID=A0ABP7BUV6_9MICO|nr:aldolase/citrate lyase family protein [Microbacterium marinilacus]MBY0688119.1 aldolase [Microbacterium marinilacus]
MSSTEFARRMRDRERIVGYWSVLDAPVVLERLGRVGYDYVAIDGQHGLLGYSGILAGLLAIDAGAAAGGTGTVGLVRVQSKDPAVIGQALDAGAHGVIVPLVNRPDDAAQAVAAATYPPNGVRSYGPMRSQLRIGPTPAEADASVVVLAMIETAEGLDHVEEIAAVPGLSGLYIGPSDLALALGARTPGDPEIADRFSAALDRIRAAADAHGLPVLIHTPDGETARRRLAEGFTGATIASDLVHLEAAARGHLQTAVGD